MADHMLCQTFPGGPLNVVDLDTLGVYDIKHKIGYSHPAEFTFKVAAPEHTFPSGIGVRNFIVYWDDSAFTQANPNFEGFVEEINPGEHTNEIEVVAYDSSFKATAEIPVMSAAWTPGVFGSTEPVEATGAVPRIVFNAFDNDDDYGFMRAAGQTTGQILATLFDDQWGPLYWLNAANADGKAYVQSELDTFLYIPQEKFVCESESLRSAVDRVLTAHPHVRYLFVPGTSSRRWRFYDILASPQYTFTLNSPDDANGNVLTLDMQRSLANVKTAFKFYGPETTITETFYTNDILVDGGIDDANDDGAYENDGTLTALTDGRQLLETYNSATGEHDVYAWRKFQIADSAKRRIANLLNIDYMAGLGDYNYLNTRSPVLEVTYDNATWMAVPGIVWDNQTGTVYWHNWQYFWTDKNPPGTTKHFWVPLNYRFTAAYYTTPLSARWPPAGFSGTGFDVANIQVEEKRYDEQLAVGYENGIPVTTATRLAQFTALAAIMQSQQRDIVYTGGMTLEEIDYEFIRLNKRVNFAAVDGDGNPLVTGWEAVNAILTDVEYDYTNRTTVLTFSSDQMSLIGWDIQTLKERLRVAGVVPLSVFNTRLLTTSVYRSKFGGVLPGNQLVVTTRDTLYYNPMLGTVENALGTPTLNDMSPNGGQDIFGGIVGE